MEEYFQIKEASKEIGVEAHVLRYWEEELHMNIHRTERGYRYYTRKDIACLKKVKELKENGIGLKVIRNYLEMRKKELEKNESEKNEFGKKEELVVIEKENKPTDEKVLQFQDFMNRVVADAIIQNSELIGKSAGNHAAGAMLKEMQEIKKEQEEKEEARYKKLDQTLREIQQARLESAAAVNRPIDRRRQARMKRNQQERNRKSKGI